MESLNDSSMMSDIREGPRFPTVHNLNQYSLNTKMKDRGPST